MLLYAAAALIVLVAIAHSYLGERYILMRLFRRGQLPHLFGGPEFTRRTLRFAWHITSLAWLGLAAALVALAAPQVRTSTLVLVIGATFLAHFAVALLASRGRHASWAVFLAIGLLCVYAAGA
jgi:hypothetical protein